jgi:hypothetical protein
MTQKTFTNEFGEVITVCKDGDQIVITHTDIPGVELRPKEGHLSTIFRTMTGGGTLIGDDGQTYMLSDDEMAFVKQAVQELSEDK